jgi:de-etiolated-1
MLDENHLLLKYASEDVVVLKTNESNSQPSLLVVYNIIDTAVTFGNGLESFTRGRIFQRSIFSCAFQVIAVYENTSKDLLYLLDNFTDHFRNAKLNCESQYTCSPSNNIYAR